MARPMIDVSSVTISPTYFPCAVYGNISAFNKLGDDSSTYVLYNRDHEKAEQIFETGQSLSVTDLDKVLSMEQPVMSLLLKIKQDNAEGSGALFASGVVELDISTSNDYEQLKLSVVEGDFGRATVNYIAISCAIVADIEVLLRERFLEAIVHDDHGINAYGNIVARYGKTFGRSNDFSIPLLNIASNQFIPIIFKEVGIGCCKKAYIKLARNQVAVPAYSSLILEACLTDTASKKLADNVTAELFKGGVRSGMKMFEGGTPRTFPSENVCMNWRWTEPYFLKMPSRHKEKRLREEFLVQLFSVFVGRENDCNLNIFGTITFENCLFQESNNIFDRDESNPDRLFDGRKLLSIGFLPCVRFDDPYIRFRLWLKLRDTENRFMVEESYAYFDNLPADVSDLPIKFDKLYCSVIKCEGGYCAIHHTVYQSAARVRVKIVLMCKGVDAAKVHGRIVAWSNRFNYTSDYDKKYYRSVLYDKPVDDNMDEHHVGEVQLFNSTIAAPIGFTLYIDADLYATSRSKSSSVERLCDTFGLKVANKKHEEKILGENFDLYIYTDILGPDHLRTC